jgi:hypothetical protein
LCDELAQLSNLVSWQIAAAKTEQHVRHAAQFNGSDLER